MSDSTGPVDDTTTLPPSKAPSPTVIPAQAKSVDDDTHGAPDDVTPAVIRPAEQLGFQMRFEAGQALLALDGRAADDGVEVRRALFEVPDVAFPLDVSGGALRFQNKRLTLRAVELAVTWDALFVPEALARHGLSLVRERSRAGGLELVVAVDGPAGPVPLRARVIFAPVGDGGVALVLHEIIGFVPLPRRRLELAPALLDALRFPGGLPARAMVRRAEPFRAVFSRLLPSHGWKVPSLGDVRVHEAVLGKGEVVLRAWSGRAPDGWKAPRDVKKGPLQDAIALAVFADGLVGTGDDAARLKLVDRLIDERALTAGAVPFAAEILRGDPRRTLDGEDLIRRALDDDDEHLGLLSAWAEARDIDAAERARRLLKLGDAADANDEPWVAGRAALAAARLADDAGDLDTAIVAATAAVEADPSVAEAGMTLSRLLIRRGELPRALSVGRAALERIGAGSLVESVADVDAADGFAVELAAVAREVDGIDAARLLLRRALRQHERTDALVPLVELEIDAGALERAAEGLARLLTLVDTTSPQKKQVELLAARLAEQRGDRDGARAHLLAARDLDPRDARVALRLSRLAEDSGDLDRALEALALVIDDTDDAGVDVDAARFAAARLLVRRAQRGGRGDRASAERSRALLALLPDTMRVDAAAVRLDAEARAVVGDTAPLAALLLDDAARTDDRRDAAQLRRTAARLFLDAGAAFVADAARALAAAFVVAADAAADIVVERIQTAGLVAAFADAIAAISAVGDSDVVDARHALARRLAAAGRPRDAGVSLRALDDRRSRELRATFAADANDVDTEIAERRGLLDVIDVAERAVRAALLVRLAILHARHADHADSADTWAAAAAIDAAVDLAAWQAAAVAANDPQRLAAVLARDDADERRIDSALLRASIPFVTDAATNRRLLASLASRNDDVADIERWLDAARQLPPAEAAVAFVDAARNNVRSDWLFAGLDALESTGDLAAAHGALTALHAEGHALLSHRDVAERALTTAVAVGDLDAVGRDAERLLGRDDLDVDARRDVRRRALAAFAGHRDRARGAFDGWLDAEPTSVEALDGFVALATDERSSAVDVDAAVARLARAAGEGRDDTIRALIVRVADTARERGFPAEAAARELLLGFDLDDTSRERTQRRLVDLSIRDGHVARAIELLHALLSQAASRNVADAVHAGLWQRVADLEDERGGHRAAATALQQLLHHAPADADASRRLQALLLELHDDEALAVESLRRARQLAPSSERTDLLLRAAGIARAAGRLDDARAIGLRALRSPPYTRRALDELLALAKQTGSRRLAIRARLAAASVLVDVDHAEAARQAAEAGGLLAGMLRRLRLGISVFTFAEQQSRAAGIEDGSHTRMLVELARALGDGGATVGHLDRLVAQTDGKERSRLLEARAEARSTMLDDDDGAIADRRAALALDPTYSAAARALSRQLGERGDIRGALDVERAFIDASAVGLARADAYARMSATAADHLHDDALTAELAAAAIVDAADSEFDLLDVRRRLVAARERLGDDAATLHAIAGLHATTTVAGERLATAERLAALLVAAGRNDEAIDVRRAALNDDAIDAGIGTDSAIDVEDYARVVVGLADGLAARHELAPAADVLLRGLERVHGAATMTPRAPLLERAAVWLDDADDGDARRALLVLGEAAAAGVLSVDGDVRRARLAEELAEPAIAVTALAALIARDVDVAANARRLAVAAEHIDDLPRALDSWKLVLADDDTDVDAWLATERLSATLHDDAALAEARHALVQLAAGGADDVARRATASGEDALARLGDQRAALRWFAEARSATSTPATRSRLLRAALALDDDARDDVVAATALAVLDEMAANDDVLDGGLYERRAGLRLRLDDSADAAAVALRDVLAAAAAGAVDESILQAQADVAVARAPVAAIDAFATTASPLLRAAIVTAGTLDDAGVDDARVVALAAAHRDDIDLQRAAARREIVGHDVGAAADRLLQLGERLGDDDVRNDGAAIAIEGGFDVLAPRLDQVRPALLQVVGARDAALTILRDAEAWSAVADVLEDAVGATANGESRRLRLQLVSVLREGLDDQAAHERAAMHLEALVELDVHDREAWGELFECLDHLGDLDRLQHALARRAAALDPVADQLERRQLVRRRAELLLQLQRAAVGIAALDEVRPAGDDDVELRALAAALHVAVDGGAGGPATIALLASELAAAQRVDDAEALLALPAADVAAVDAGLRRRARLAAIVDDDSAAAQAARELFIAAPIELRRAEAVAVVVDLLDAGRPAHAAATVRGLAAAMGRLGYLEALHLTDALFAEARIVAALDDTLREQLAIAGFTRRLRTAGAAATFVDVERLVGRARDAATLRRAARLARRDDVAAAAAALGLDLAGTALAPATFVQRARDAAATASATNPIDTTLALIRHGAPGAVAAIETLDDDGRRRLARRAQALSLRGPRRTSRLAPRLLLAPLLDDPIADIERIAIAARADGDVVTEARALDALDARRPPTAPWAIRRADVALALREADAWTRAAAAADIADDAGNHDDAQRLRRTAIDAFVLAHDLAPLGAALLAMARRAPGGVAGDVERTEARSIAEAARLNDVVDAILQASEDALVDVADRLAAVRDRAALRLRRFDAPGAFRALVDASGTIGDADVAMQLREEAWQVACGHGLTLLALEVVDDELARAGLLAALGRTRGALEVAATLDTPAAWWLIADCARADGDDEAEERALVWLADHGVADDGALVRLIDAARRRGDIDDAARRALALLGRGAGVARVRLLADCASTPIEPTLRRAAATALLDVAGNDATEPAVRELALGRGADVAALLGDDGARLRRDFRQALARLHDDDQSWVDALLADLADPAVDDDEALRVVRRQIGRGPVIGGALRAASSTAATRLAAALQVIARSDDGPRVVEALTTLTPRSPAFTLVLADALMHSGRQRDAAELFVTHAAETHDPASLVRGARLFVDVGAFGAAARALLALERDDLDDEVLGLARDVVNRAARDGALGDAARLAAAIGHRNGDKGFIALSLGYADAAGGDTAIAIAAARLRAGDLRALALLARHSLEGSAQQGYFGAWHALRSGVLSFAPHAPRDFARVADVADRTRSLPRPASSPTTDLQRARSSSPTTRASAWKALAATIAATDELGSARLLVRAGVPMSEAPLEVRLAVDPALADDAARASAIAASLDDVADDRRAAVVATFDAVVARGGSTAHERLRVDTLIRRDRGLAALVDHAAIGDVIDVVALVRSLGRHPSPSQRAQAAALLVMLGEVALASALEPGIGLVAAADNRAHLLALRSVDDDDGLVALGQLRLSQLAGPRLDIEERIAAIATRLGRTDLLAESLLRQARLHSARDDRAAALVRYADVVVVSAPVAATRAARAAFALDRSPAAAQALLHAADARDDAATLDEALRALLALDDDGVAGIDRLDVVRRSARVLAHRMLRAEDALALLDEQATRTPQFVLFSDKAELHERLLLQPLDAALAILAGIAVDGAALGAVERRQWRRRAAELLTRIVEDGDRSVTLAIEALCASFIDDNDLAALDDAEALARARAPRAPLAKVLELRLREIEDVNARRDLVLEHARLLHDLDDGMGAIAMLEAQAVADPVDLGARLALAGWYLEGRRVLDAALAFESAARISGLPAVAFGPPAREAASLLAALGDLERAGPLADLAVTAGFDDLDVLAVAGAWHRAHDRWSTVDDLLDKELAHVTATRAIAHVWMERAVIRRDRLNDETAAKKALHRVLELVADHPRALQMMRDDAARADTWGALRMALFRAVDVVDDPVRQAGWLREIAQIDADRLDDRKAAQATIDRALALAPDDVDSLVLKASLLVKAGQLDGLSAVMEKLERHGKSELPGQLHLVRGDALLVAGANDEARAAFRLATDDPDSSTRAWDRLIDMAPTAAEALPLLDEARKSTVDNRRRLQLWRQEQRLRTRNNDDAGVVDVAEQILALEPGDSDALKLVSEAWRRRRKLRELVPLLANHARAVDAAAQPIERARRLADVGVFALDEAGQESAARGFFEEALGLDADQPTALVRMADIAWASRDDERALVLLDRISPETWSTLVDDHGAPRTTTELFLRRARCAWSLGNSDVRERLRQVLRVDAGNVAALDLLARVARDDNDDDAAEMALESLSQALAGEDDPVRLAAVFVELATLRLRRGKADEALAAAERAFDLDPGNIAVLRAVAEAREAGGRFVDAAEAWRRVAAVRAGDERVVALDHRVQALLRAERTRESIDAWLDLFNETGDQRHKDAAVDLAKRTGIPELLARVGLSSTSIADGVGAPTIETPAAVDLDGPDLTQTQAMAAAPGLGGAVAIQLRANLDDNDPANAVKIALAAREQVAHESESSRLAVEAAVRGQQFDLAVDFAEARLTHCGDAAEVLTVALTAGRIARDRLHDDDRAAALLYQAHQADAEDVEVRLELTELYARIPRLASHAVTGILQLLRRTPGDARVFALAASLATSQGQSERATGLRAIETLLRGRGVPAELLNTRNADERSTATILPLDRDAIATRLAPTGWGGPLQQLITLLGVHLEVAVGSAPTPPDAKALVQASPRAQGLIDRIERLLPGRPVHVVIADVASAAIAAGGVPTVVLPRELLANEAALHAAIARGYAVVRFGAVLSETVKAGGEADVVSLLRAGLLGEGAKDARSELLTARLREEDKAAAVALARQCLVGTVDLAAVLQIVSRACDRFALVATGSPVAAMQAATLPTLLKESPQRAMTSLQNSVRALELCAFAARDNAWLLRRQHLLN